MTDSPPSPSFRAEWCGRSFVDSVTVPGLLALVLAWLTSQRGQTQGARRAMAGDLRLQRRLVAVPMYVGIRTFCTVWLLGVGMGELRRGLD